MIRLLETWPWIGAGLVITMAATLGPPGAVAEEESAGRTTFMDAKCNLCHAVPAADIAAKTTSEKLRGPELGGPLPEGTTLEEMAAYLRKQAPRDGEEHKKEFKGTDEELQSIFDWLAELPSVETAED